MSTPDWHSAPSSTSAAGPSRTVGLDVGGTKIAATALMGGVLAAPRLAPTALHSAAALIEQLAAAIAALGAEGPIAAVGVGVAGVVDFATGQVRHSINTPLSGVRLRDRLTERIGVPVFVDNDVRCAALAEAHTDGELVCPELVMLTIGTGVGGGVILNGRVYRGVTGGAGELGHTLLGLDLADGAPPPVDHLPQPGSLEALAAGRALSVLALDAARTHPRSRLGQALAGGGDLTPRDVMAAAAAGDKGAADAICVLGQRLGVGIANAINTFDPLEVVIGGGIASAALLENASATARRWLVPGVGTRTTIRLARHGALAGAVGAAMLAAYELGAPIGS